jgi:hypothetical protein
VASETISAGITIQAPAEAIFAVLVVSVCAGPAHAHVPPQPSQPRRRGGQPGRGVRPAACEFLEAGLRPRRVSEAMAGGPRR